MRAGCKDIKITYVPQILSYFRIHPSEIDVADQRAATPSKYQQAVAVYHEVLTALKVYGKIDDPGNLLAITREIFRVSRKLLRFKDTDTVIKIMQHLVSTGIPTTKVLRFFFFCARMILLSRYVIPSTFQAVAFDRLCHLAMILGVLSHFHPSELST